MLQINWWHISLLMNTGITVFYLAVAANIGIRWWVSKAETPQVVPVSSIFSPVWWHSREREMGWAVGIFFSCALGHAAMLSHLYLGLLGWTSDEAYNAAKLNSDWHVGLSSMLTFWIGGMYWKHITDKHMSMLRVQNKTS